MGSKQVDLRPRAYAAKKSGDLDLAGELFMQVCADPDEVPATHRAMFVVLRKLNARDLKLGAYSDVARRVTKMIRMDDERDRALLAHCSRNHGRALPADTFESHRNLKVTDIKALWKAADALSDEEALKKANGLLAERNARGPRSTALGLSLEKQCRAIGVELTERRVTRVGRVEETVLGTYLTEGFDGSACEGGAILTVVHALMLSELRRGKPSGQSSGVGSVLASEVFALRTPSNGESESRLNRERRIALITSIGVVSTQQFKSNLSEILGDEVYAAWKPKVTEEFSAALERALDRSAFAAVAEAIFEDPYAYNKGWPDLTLVRGAEVRFVEVKAKDRLHESQLRTIPRMKRALGCTFEIVRAKRG